MKKYRLHLLALILLAACSLAYSQKGREQIAGRPATVEALNVKRQSEVLGQERLAQLLSAVGVRGSAPALAPARSYQALSVRWTSPAKTTTAAMTTEEAQATEVAATVLARQTRSGTLPRQRSLELSSDHLLVLTVDADARLRWWSLLPDPRLLRAEAPGPDGQLSGQVIYRPQADFALDVPEDAAATELRLYHPRWTGDGFALVLINTIPLAKN